MVVRSYSRTIRPLIAAAAVLAVTVAALWTGAAPVRAADEEYPGWTGTAQTGISGFATVKIAQVNVPAHANAVGYLRFALAPPPLTDFGYYSAYWKCGTWTSKAGAGTAQTRQVILTVGLDSDSDISRSCSLYIWINATLTVYESRVSILYGEGDGYPLIPPPSMPPDPSASPDPSATPTPTADPSATPSASPEVCWVELPDGYLGPPAPTSCPSPSPSPSPSATPERCDEWGVYKPWERIGSYVSAPGIAPTGCSSIPWHADRQYRVGMKVLSVVPDTGSGAYGGWGVDLNFEVASAGDQRMTCTGPPAVDAECWTDWQSSASVGSPSLVQFSGFMTGSASGWTPGMTATFMVEVRNLDGTYTPAPSATPDPNATQGPIGNGTDGGPLPSDPPQLYVPGTGTGIGGGPGGTGPCVPGPLTGECKPGSGYAVMPDCPNPFPSINPLDYFGWIGCLVSSIPTAIGNGLTWLLNGLVDLFVPAPLGPFAQLGSFLDMVQEKAPFGYVPQLAAALTAPAWAGPVPGLSFVIAGETIDAGVPLTAAVGALAPFRGVFEAFVWLLLAFALLRLVRGALGGGDSGGGGE